MKWAISYLRTKPILTKHILFRVHSHVMCDLVLWLCVLPCFWSMFYRVTWIFTVLVFLQPISHVVWALLHPYQTSANQQLPTTTKVKPYLPGVSKSYTLYHPDMSATRIHFQKTPELCLLSPGVNLYSNMLAADQAVQVMDVDRLQQQQIKWQLTCCMCLICICVYVSF